MVVSGTAGNEPPVQPLLLAEPDFLISKTIRLRGSVGFVIWEVDEGVFPAQDAREKDDSGQYEYGNDNAFNHFPHDSIDVLHRLAFDFKLIILKEETVRFLGVRITACADSSLISISNTMES